MMAKPARLEPLSVVSILAFGIAIAAVPYRTYGMSMTNVSDETAADPHSSVRLYGLRSRGFRASDTDGFAKHCKSCDRRQEGP